MKRFTACLLIAVSSALPFGCNATSMTEHPSNKAKGHVSGNVSCQSETQILNGEYNYGITATLTAQNIGQSGFLTVKVYLNTSEGEWNRGEELILCSGESRALTYFFHEPTRNATNVQCRATISP